jgi:hypothetical protein
VNVSGMGIVSKVMVLPVIRPAPIILLLLAIVSAVAYARRKGDQPRNHFASAKATVHH